MTERKPQIAYAPVSPSMSIDVRHMRYSADDVVSTFQPSEWAAARIIGWRIARVRIELDEEKSGE